MSVSKRTRFEVFKRDKFTCQYCGKRPPDVVLEADHIVPKVEGGGGGIENLTTACEPCNRGKAGISLDEVAPALDEMEVLAALQEMLERKRALEQQIVVAQAQHDLEQRAFEVVLDWYAEGLGDLYALEVQPTSIKKFLESLEMEDVRGAIGVTATRSIDDAKQAWLYFCGVCWKMIRDSTQQGVADVR